MQPDQPPPLTRQRLDAFHASALCWLGWLMGVILRLAAPGRGKRLRGVIVRMEREVEAILLCEAALRFGPPPQHRRRPRPTPMGFRRTQHRRLALFYKRAGVRARKQNALARVLRLIDVLARPERFIAYFFERLSKGLRLTALVAVAPPAWALAFGAPARVVLADSS